MHQLGSTRSVSRREYLLHTPDAFVRTPMPGLNNGAAIVHVAPVMGAGFAMTTVELEPGGTLTSGPVQRFLYVMDGELDLQEPSSDEPHKLGAGSFAMLPSQHPHTLSASTSVRIIMLEKPFVPLDPEAAEALDSTFPKFFTGHESNVASVPLNGDEGLQVRNLLPLSSAFDFAVNTMTYDPGASLGQVEVHWMEHGLLMLEGGGIYRLGSDWHPVEAGDVIWMAPFCPQWFGAIGKHSAKYLIYKDFNRHVMA